MGSPDDPEATQDATEASRAALPLPAERIQLPVYRPRRTVSVRFWLGFLVAVLVVGLVVWLVLA